LQYNLPMKPEKDSHCSYCGHTFGTEKSWPRTCPGCGQTSYRNPIPVAVVLLPIDNGLLAIRRTLPDGRGKLALPGGYVNAGESWQHAAARELFEETGIQIDAGEIADFRVLSAPDGTVLIFGLARPRKLADLPAFQGTDETSERVVCDKPMELAFSLHTQVMRDFFDRRV
jgi:ADP-ribose pyrophosphatase YjhB (NUDIX family)